MKELKYSKDTNDCLIKVLRVLKKYDYYKSNILCNFNIESIPLRDIMWSLCDKIFVPRYKKYVFDILILQQLDILQYVSTVKTDCDEIFRPNSAINYNELTIPTYNKAQCEYQAIRGNNNTIVEFVNRWFSNDEFIADIFKISDYNQRDTNRFIEDEVDDVANNDVIA
ncbi:MAG: hypothetical protein MJ221_04380 [Bacilli bacterium]|nr:hypothetical protein [Bacilli bacterium]